MKLPHIILGFIVCFAQLWGEDITVTPQTFTGTQKVGTVTTENIVTQGTVTVVSGANITFGANNSITLKPGFTASNYFRAYIDTSVYISFAASTSSVAENGGSISIPITLSRAATEPIAINYAATSGTATGNGDDYALSAGALNIPAGTTAGNITVTINDDAVYEGGETVVITLSNPVGGILGGITAHTLTIIDNDEPTVNKPTVTLAVTDDQALEPSDNSAEFVLTRTGDTDADLPVQIAWSGSATLTTDFTISSDAATVIIPAGQTQAVITLTPVGDQDLEGTETATLSVVANNNYVLGDNISATATIADATLTLTATRTTLNEERSYEYVALQITRTGYLGGPAITVPISMSGTAVLDTDYTTSLSEEPEPPTLPAGNASTQVFSIYPRTNNETFEPEKLLSVIISSPPNYALIVGTQNISIVDEDRAVSLTTQDADMGEKDANVGISRLSRSGLTADALTVQLTRAGAAMPLADYTTDPAIIADSTTNTMSVTIPAGESGIDITFTPVDDNSTENIEDITLSIEESSAYTIASGSNQIRIDDNDTPIVRLIPISPQAFEGGYYGALRIERHGDLYSSITIPITATGTADSGIDYTALPANVTLDSGVETYDIYVMAIDDEAVEGDEIVQLALNTGEGYTLDPAASSAVVTIINANRPTVTIVTINHTNEGNATFPGIIRISRTGPVSASLPVAISVDGTATPNDDFTRTPSDNTIIIPAGQASCDIQIHAINDYLSEGDETVTVTLQPSIYALTSANSATLIIGDDELPTIRMTATDNDVREHGLETGTFTITSSAALFTDLTIPLTVSGSANAGSDYDALPSAVTIPAGAQSVTVIVAPRDDEEIENNEMITAHLGENSILYTTSSIDAQASITLFSDDLPAPVITYQIGSALIVEASGIIQTQLDITELIATTTTAGVQLEPMILSGGFALRATLTSVGITSAPVTLQFRDARGITGPSSSATLIWATGSGTIGSGDGNSAPLMPPTVTLKIADASLTGDKRGTWKEKQVAFTNTDSDKEKAVQFNVSASSVGGIIESITLTSSDGQTQTIAGGGGTLALKFPQDGVYTLEASATAKNQQGMRASNTSKSEMLVVDRTAPEFEAQVDVAFGGTTEQPKTLQLIHKDETKDSLDQIGYFSSLNRKIIALNRNEEGTPSGNKYLRDNYGWEMYNRDDFRFKLIAINERFGLTNEHINKCKFYYYVSDCYRDKDRENTKLNDGHVNYEVIKEENDNRGWRINNNNISALDSEEALQYEFELLLIGENIADRCGNVKENKYLSNYYFGHKSIMRETKVTELFQFRIGDKPTDWGWWGFTVPPGVSPLRFGYYYDHRYPRYWQNERLRENEMVSDIGLATLVRPKQLKVYPGYPDPSFVDYFYNQNCYGDIARIDEYDAGLHQFTYQVQYPQPIYIQDIPNKHGYTPSLSFLLSGYAVNDDDDGLVTVPSSFTFMTFNQSITYNCWLDESRNLMVDADVKRHINYPTNANINLYTVDLEKKDWGEGIGIRDWWYRTQSGLIETFAILPGEGANCRFDPAIISLPNEERRRAMDSGIIDVKIRDEGVSGCVSLLEEDYEQYNGMRLKGINGNIVDAQISLEKLAKAQYRTEGLSSPYFGNSQVQYFSITALTVAGEALKDQEDTEENSYLYKERYVNTYRFCNTIRMSKFSLSAGSTEPLVITSYFTNENFRLEDFRSSGKYINFFDQQGNNVTALSEERADDDKKIRIVSQRLFASHSFWDENDNQHLELVLQIGSQVPAGLYDIDIKLGQIKAQTAKLGKQYAGKNGAHRMKEALAIVQVAYETEGHRTATGLKKSQSIPKVSINSFSTGNVSISGGIATVQISGRIEDQLAGLMKNSVMTAVNVLDKGKPVGQIAVNAVSDTPSDYAPFAKHFTFSGSVQIPASPGIHEMELITSANEMGVSGSARFSVQLDASYPNPLITSRTSATFTVMPTATTAGVITLSLPSGTLLGAPTVVTLTETAPNTHVFVDNGNVYELIRISPVSLNSAIVDELAVQIKKNGVLIANADGIQIRQQRLVETGNNTVTFISDYVHTNAVTSPTTLTYIMDVGAGLSSTQVNQITLQLPEHIAGSGASPVTLTESGNDTRIFNGNAGSASISVTLTGATTGSTLQSSITISGTPVVVSAFTKVGSTPQYSYQTTLTSDAPVARVVSAAIGDSDQSQNTWEPYRIRFSAPSELIDDMVTKRKWYHNGVEVSMTKVGDDYYVGADQKPRVMVDPIIIPPKIPGDPKGKDETVPPPAPVNGNDLTYSGTVSGSNGTTVSATITVKRSEFSGAPDPSLTVYITVTADAAGKKTATIDLDVRAKLQQLAQLAIMTPGVYQGSLSLIKEIAGAGHVQGQAQTADGGGTFAAADPRMALSDEVKAWDVVTALDGKNSWVWNPNDNPILPPPILWTLPNVSSAPSGGYSLRSSVQIALLGPFKQIDDSVNFKERTVIEAMTVFVGQGGLGNLTPEEALDFYQVSLDYVQVYDAQNKVPANTSYRVGDVRAEFRDQSGILDITKLVANYNTVKNNDYIARLAKQKAVAEELAGVHFDTNRSLAGGFVQVFSVMGQITDPTMYCSLIAGGEGIILPDTPVPTWAAAAWGGAYLMVDVIPVGRLFNKGKALFRKASEAELPPHKNPSVVKLVSGGSGKWAKVAGSEVIDPSIIRQIHSVSCAPTCAAMLMRERGVVAFQSALAVRQRTIETSLFEMQKLADAMNDIEKSKAWRGASVDIFTNPRSVFNTLNTYGSFTVSLKTWDMPIAHNVVIDGLDAAENVIIRDPETCTKYLVSWSVFVEAWERGAGASIWRTVP
jgi:Calx-beta domain